MSIFNLFGQLFNQGGAGDAAQFGMPTLSGSNVNPNAAKARAVTPGFLAKSPLGFMQQALLAGLFGQRGGAQRLAQQQASQLLSSGRQRADSLRGAAGARGFRGSAVGEALAQGVQSGSESQAQSAIARGDEAEFQRQLALSSAISGGFTQPLLQSLGLGPGEKPKEPSTLDKILGFAGGLFCWVARAVFGEDNPKWKDARAYILFKAPGWFQRLYAAYGPALAKKVEQSHCLRWCLRPVFEYFAWRGRALELDPAAVSLYEEG